MRQVDALPARYLQVDEADKKANTGPSNVEAFEFVKALASEVSAGKVELPSFPDVAVRVRRLLADQGATVDQVVRIVGSEPALTVRIIKMANSAALNRSGKQITELRTAIKRMGFNMVRSASLSFAMAQMRANPDFKGIEEDMRDLWQTTTYVAAFCYVLARHHAGRNPDEAFLAGLLHGVGRLYILTRMPKHPVLMADKDTVAVIMREWHSSVAKAILENWEMSESLVSAVSVQDDPHYEHGGTADLGDVLVVANMMTAYHDHPDTLVLNMAGVKSFGMLGLDQANCAQVLADSREEIEALRQALGT